MRDKTAIITIGISGSGKTTWANEFVQNNSDYIIVCRDDIRRQLQIENNINPGISGVNWQQWNWGDEYKVTKLFWELIENTDKNVIIADTNLNHKRMCSMCSKLIDIGFTTITLKRFEVSLNEAIRRDSLRENSVGVDVIQKQYNQLNNI